MSPTLPPSIFSSLHMNFRPPQHSRTVREPIFLEAPGPLFSSSFSFRDFPFTFYHFPPPPPFVFTCVWKGDDEEGEGGVNREGMKTTAKGRRQSGRIKEKISTPFPDLFINKTNLQNPKKKNLFFKKFPTTISTTHLPNLQFS